MKHFVIIILSVFFINTGFSQVGKKIFPLIESGDIEGILNLADKEIDLCLLDDQNIYNKSEARKKLQTFFSIHPPASCQPVHSGKSKERRSAYVLGKMKAKDGSIYRVFIYANAKDKLMELRIDEW